MSAGVAARAAFTLLSLAVCVHVATRSETAKVLPGAALLAAWVSCALAAGLLP